MLDIDFSSVLTTALGLTLGFLLLGLVNGLLLGVTSTEELAALVQSDNTRTT